MVRLEQQLVYATPTTPLVYQQSDDDLWGSPRGTVLRIQALALVAIALSFLLVAFGSCRRWSNRWIVQKGFSAAQVLSLSLGTYSIGLMQSSSVKSELYPVWAVSLLTLLGCVDPVTTYMDLDYKGPFLKVIFQLCLYSGYILLMSASTTSGLFGNIAIGILSAITFIKGFHRALALVQPSIIRFKLRELDYKPTESSVLESRRGQELVVHFHLRDDKYNIMMSDIRLNCDNMMHRKLPMNYLDHSDGPNSTKKTSIIENVCLGYSLSHLLRRRFLGMNTASEMEERRKLLFKDRPKSPHIYEKTLKAIEVELAFLYEVFFTSNEFLHYYEAKTSSFWALASFVGICLVGIAAAKPGTMASRYYHRNTYTPTTTGPGTTSVAAAVVVNTTTADLVITLVILASLALLQLMQLMRCWTSNWATVAFACEYNREQGLSQSRWMKLKLFLISSSGMNYRVDSKYLWQDKLGQYSVVAAAKRTIREEQGWCSISIDVCLPRNNQLETCAINEMLALRYIKQAVKDLSWSIDTKGGAVVRLHGDVKANIAEFLGRLNGREMIGTDLKCLLRDNGLEKLLEHLPFTTDRPLMLGQDQEHNTTVASDTFAFTHRVMVWHIMTWYCELAEQEERRTTVERGGAESGGGGGGKIDKNRRVAIALSKYCAYLVVSAPELLPGPSAETKRAWNRVKQQASQGVSSLVLSGRQGGLAAIVSDEFVCSEEQELAMRNNDAFWTGVHCGKELRKIGVGTSWSWAWDVLARLWVRTLLYAAPSGDVDAHMRHLSQGGEFISHLWALLYHIGIVDKWETETETVDDHDQPRKKKRRAKATRGDHQQTPGSSNIRSKSKQ